MSVEANYHFDETLGLYGPESRQRLATMAMDSFVRFERSLESAAMVEDVLNETFPSLKIGAIGAYRLGSLVESPESRTGYALTVSPIDQSDLAVMGGVWYRINRFGRDDQPEISESKGILIARPETLKNEREKSSEIESLMSQFGKAGLESIMRMLGKMTASLDVALESIMTEEEASSPSEVFENNTRMQTLANVEPRVATALGKRHALRHQKILFPKNRAPVQANTSTAETQAEQKPEIEHITEWQELIDAAKDLIQRETDPNEAISTVAVQYEADDAKLYMANFRSEFGELTGIQYLDTDARLIQTFDLSTDTDEDDIERNQVRPVWDRKTLLACAKQGELIDGEDYDVYRQMVAVSLSEGAAEKRSNLVDMATERQKRRAA